MRDVMSQNIKFTAFVLLVFGLPLILIGVTQPYWFDSVRSWRRLDVAEGMLVALFTGLFMHLLGKIIVNRAVTQNGRITGTTLMAIGTCVIGLYFLLTAALFPRYL